MNAQSPQTILSLDVPCAEADGLAEWLAEHFAVSPVQLARPDGTRAWLEIYFGDAVEAELLRQALKEHPLIGHLELRTCAPRDWLSFWRHHFHTHTLGERLRICPAWEAEAAPHDERINLLVDPGLSFGTGEHFTTRFCLETIDRLSRQDPPRSFCDIGTGSGILAIAASRLGCPRVLGTDCDEIALEQARRNLALNGVERGVELAVQDITALAPTETFDIVCANLYGHLLMTCAPALLRITGRHLILSGLKESEVEAVADVFVGLGARQRTADGDGEWGGLLLDVTSSPRR